MHDDTILRTARVLQTSRRARDERGLFLIEGVGHFVAAVDGSVPLRAVLHSPGLLSSPVAEKLVRRRRRAGTPVVKVSPGAFRSFSKASRPSGVAAIAEQRVTPLERVDPAEGLFWLVLDSVRSPGNLGTLLRTSAAVGGGGVILAGPRVDPFDPVTVRASMHALLRQRVVRTDPGELGRWIKERRLRLTGASPAGGTTHFRHRFARPALIALGDERTGLSRSLGRLCHATVRIPMRPGADSLNLGVAGALLMYEVVRAAGGPSAERSVVSP